jgi:basic membrane protein A and related proteins
MKIYNSIHALFIFCFAVLFMPLAQAASDNSSQQPLKVGFVCVGPVNDWGWNYAHDLGRKFLESKMHGKVATTMVENIPESAEAERVMEKMIAQGNRLIFSTSYGYLEPAERVAKHHPEVIIMQTWRPSAQKNIGMFAAYPYQVAYVSGIVAGRMTKKNQIGFVCAHPVPNILQSINAFTFGARSVNPRVKVNVVWTNAWSDPATEAEAAKGLIEQGVDILDSPLTVIQIAEKNHVMVLGSQVDLHQFAPTEWLTGSRWNWNDFYLKIAKSVQDGTWKPEHYWLGMKDDAVELSPFGKLVPKVVRDEATSVANKIKAGNLIIFKGSLKDREGNLRLAPGKVADAQWLAQMNFFVDGVEGIPK